MNKKDKDLALLKLRNDHIHFYEMLDRSLDVFDKRETLINIVAVYRPNKLSEAAGNINADINKDISDLEVEVEENCNAFNHRIMKAMKANDIESLLEALLEEMDVN